MLATAWPMEKALTDRYLATPTRAIHSWLGLGLGLGYLYLLCISPTSPLYLPYVSLYLLELVEVQQGEIGRYMEIQGDTGRSREMHSWNSSKSSRPPSETPACC